MKRVLATTLAVLLCACGSAPRDAAPATVPAADDATADVAAPAPAPDVLPPPELAGGDTAPTAPAADDAGASDAPPPANTIAVGEPNPAAPTVVDASCKTDADCAIKDVGSCCGYRPQCVNAASPTFPDRVQAQCAKEGRVSTCGFPAITGCQCVSGTCQGTGAGAPQVR